MRRMLRRLRFLAVGIGCLVATLPTAAQQAGCSKGSASTTTASTSSQTSVASTAGTQMRQGNAQSQIAQLQLLLSGLQSGQVTPPAGSGLTTAQAIQLVQQRINALQQISSRSSAVASTQRGGNMAGNQSMMSRSSMRGGRR